MAKCPVCDWKIEGKGITVESGGEKTIVCCRECGDKLVKSTPPKSR